MRVKFSLGQLVATPGGCGRWKKRGSPRRSSWRSTSPATGARWTTEDRRANDEALVNGERLLSAYKTLRGVKLWVITEADRSSTCCLFPEEY